MLQPNARTGKRGRNRMGSVPRRQTTRISTISVLIMTFVGLPSPASAAFHEWNCTYQTFASPNGIKDADGFAWKFLYDDVTQKAVGVGNLGMEDMIYFEGVDGVTFLEELPSGAIQTTTISRSGSSVHSRHSLMGNEL